ncbi:hypothetical protein BKA81DRAFT_407258 [Phyllosticta paracitricarpa]|uniref:Translation initiation factor eIF4B n=1 Tax=Phyllosticta citricarpa TaxID=55181 RepID=A0ABR1M2B3_9PEZI
MSLGDFLGDQSLGSWADEMEDLPVTSERFVTLDLPSYLANPAAQHLTSFRTGPSTGYGSSRPTFGSSGGGMGSVDRAADRGFAVREELPLPTKPPFTAHLGNLSYDATEGDIQDFFDGCDVTNVRIVEDKLDHRPKGFGYVEFGTVEGLKKALSLGGTQFQGRNIKVSVADPPKDRVESRVFDDWTRKGPLPPIEGQRRSAGSGFNRGFGGPESDAGSERGGRRPFEGDGRVRDFGNWERKGPLSPVTPAAGPPREAREPREPRERKMSPNWGEARSNSRPRRDFSESRPPVERQPTAADLDDSWRSKMKPDSAAKSPEPATPEISSPSSPAAKPAVPATRPKLNLQKRTVSETPAAPTSASGDSKASPFGAARPIDTAAKERQIEERRQLAIRQKKEADDKAREEKRKQEAAAPKTERSASGQSNKKEDEKENGADSPTPGRNYEILQRMDDNNEGDEEKTNGDAVDDKASKPSEAPKEAKPQEQSWRRADTAPAAEAKDDDGWSTVPSNKKNNRRGGSRAMAS